MDPPTPEVRGLFRQPPESFVAARDVLVKRLRTEGREDEARAVKALRKPTVPAWALDQLADRDPSGIETLLDTGAQVRAAQQAALTARDPERLRVATAVRRAAVTALADAAAAALTEAGRDPAPHRDAVVAALEAAAVDPAAAEDLRNGTFERPPASAAGFGDLAGLSVLPGGAATEDDAEEESAPSRGRGGAREVDLTQRTRLRDAEVRRARRERATADDLARQLHEAQSHLERLRARHAGAEAKADAAEADARRAERDLARAQKSAATPRSRSKR